MSTDVAAAEVALLEEITVPEKKAASNAASPAISRETAPMAVTEVAMAAEDLPLPTEAVVVIETAEETREDILAPAAVTTEEEGLTAEKTDVNLPTLKSDHICYQHRG